LVFSFRGGSSRCKSARFAGSTTSEANDWSRRLLPARDRRHQPVSRKSSVLARSLEVASIRAAATPPTVALLVSDTGSRRADQRDARADPKAGRNPADCACPPVRRATRGRTH
jgi:hypothetical protein